MRFWRPGSAGIYLHSRVESLIFVRLQRARKTPPTWAVPRTFQWTRGVIDPGEIDAGILPERNWPRRERMYAK